MDAHDRVRDKDALDVLRLLRAVDTDVLADRIRSLLADDLSRSVTDEAVELLPELFGGLESDGTRMAVRAAGAGEDAATIGGSMIALVEDLRLSLE